MNEELMEIAEQESVEDVNLSIPRGGPLHIPHKISPLTCIRDFKVSVVNQLQALKSELLSDSDEDEDISVDDLKVFTEEELVDMAMKEAFQADEHTENSAVAVGTNDGNEVAAEKDACSQSSHRGKNASSSLELTNESQPGIIVEVPASSTKRLKPRKKKSKNYQRQMKDRDTDTKKLEHLAKIKEKQDEDRAATKLHCFNPSGKVNESAFAFSERIERMKSIRSSYSEYKVKASYIWENKPIQYPEVVLCVEVSHTSQRHTKNQEFLILGSQMLTELRDKIYCLTDNVMEKAGDHDSSGYFLIEGVFYSDLRDQSAIDYSEPVFDWLKKSRDEAEQKWNCILAGDTQKRRKSIVGEVQPPDLPRFKRAAMQKTRFSDLRFRLGTGYLYLHQGDCKHRIVFRDMRLFHGEDVQNQVAYPIVTFQRKLRTRKCDVCHIYRAAMVTLDDKWAGENPCYFCNDCYFLLHHHNEDGSLLYNDFLVYDYVHE